jgi:hypothetical protein
MRVERKRGTRKIMMIALLIVGLFVMASFAASAAPKQGKGKPYQSVTVEWYYVWDGVEDKPELPSPFHIHTVHKGKDTSKRYTQVLDWDYRTISNGFLKFFFLEYDDVSYYETFSKGDIVTDDFPYNDIPDNMGEPWDKHPETT